MLHPIDYSPKNREVIQSCRLFAQKLLIENDKREAVGEAREALTAALMSEFRIRVALEECQKIVAERTEDVRLAEEALSSAGASFDGACLDFHATLVEEERPAMTDDEAHAILQQASA